MTSADWRVASFAGTMDVAGKRGIWKIHLRDRRMELRCCSLGSLLIREATVLRIQ